MKTTVNGIQGVPLTFMDFISAGSRNNWKKKRNWKYIMRSILFEKLYPENSTVKKFPSCMFITFFSSTFLSLAFGYKHNPKIFRNEI